MKDNEAVSVAYVCSLVPVEIVSAAGFRPLRLIPQGRYQEAEGIIHPNTCFYVKSLLADALKGAYPPVGAVVLANSCDAMRRLFDLWNAYVKRPPAFFLDMPKMNGPDAVEVFSAALRRLGEELSNMPGASRISHSSLEATRTETTRTRRHYTEVFSALQKGCLKGTEVFMIMQEGAQGDPAGLMKEIAGNHECASSPASYPGGCNVLIVGNILNKPAVLNMIESAGGSVSTIDTCFGQRSYELLVQEGSEDPYTAVAERYLKRPPCMRMMDIRDQTDYLCRTIRDTKAQGVVVSKVKFCDNLSFVLPALEDAIRSSHARCLVLENDYAFTDTEKTRIKVEAFIETMGKEG